MTNGSGPHGQKKGSARRKVGKKSATNLSRATLAAGVKAASRRGEGAGGATGAPAGKAADERKRPPA
jgi:hypothetical protein